MRVVLEMITITSIIASGVLGGAYVVIKNKDVKKGITELVRGGHE